MRFSQAIATTAFLFVVTGLAPAADGVPPLGTATGVVEKATKDSLRIKPRGADGKFQKTIVLKVTGTSKVAILIPQNAR